MSAPQIKLIDVAELEELIGASGLDEKQKEYLRKRWLHQFRWWDERAWKARGWYFRVRKTIVIGGVLVPFLTTASLSARLDPWPRGIGAAISLLVAALAALEALYGWGGIWLEKRRAAELLKVQGWLFLHGGGSYQGRSAVDAFPEFVTEVETQIAAEVGEYVATAKKNQETRRPSSTTATTPTADRKPSDDKSTTPTGQKPSDDKSTTPTNQKPSDDKSTTSTA